MTGNELTFDRRPVYAVLFDSATAEGSYLPVVGAPYGADAGVTVPHGFDREVAVSLAALWYCLHLPNTFFELVDASAAHMKAAQGLHLDHHILLAPADAFDHEHVSPWLVHGVPLLAVCPDQLIDDVAQRSEALGFLLPPVAQSQLSSDGLSAHWRGIEALFPPATPFLGREPALTRRLDLAPADLPRRWLARQFGQVPGSGFVDDGDRDALVAHALWTHTVLAATARLEREHESLEVAEQRMPSVIEEEQVRLRVPVVLALPGVAPAYVRRAYDSTLRGRIVTLPAVDEADTWSSAIKDRDDALVERAAIEFATTHRAVARGGIGLMLSSVPPAAFAALLQLEQHLREANPSGPTVWRLLDRLNAATEDLWTEALAALVAHASELTVFSNFPIGLLRLPGDSSPLSARLPIAYRPLLPLTRAVQMELTYVPAMDLSSHPQVLVAECIPNSDPVGVASRAAWDVAVDRFGTAGEGMTLEVVETLSVEALRAAIDQSRPSVLVISAHGVLSKDRTVAGLQIGDDVVLGGLGPLPPVVILSACHVAPRGAGTISITDMLLREGAVAVLGTQVPVDVRRNAILMARFLVYIAEALARRETHSTLLDVWHRVQKSNAVNDVISGSPSLRKWGVSTTSSGRSVVEEFMLARSTGRLRNGHIYADTEQVLGEIADEQGEGPTVRNWFQRPGYVPESLFYVFAGRPERVYLRPLADVVTDPAE